MGAGLTSEDRSSEERARSEFERRLLAYLEAAIIMTRLLRNYRFRLSPLALVAPEAWLTLRPRYGLWVETQPT